jgi:hypothetical protein
VPLDAVAAPPADPEFAAVVTPTSSTVALLRGTRPVNTALLVDGVEVVGRDGSSAFRLALPLRPGTNAFLAQSVDAVGTRSAGVVVSVVHDDQPPSAVSFAAFAPRTARAVLPLAGEKDRGCRVVRDGEVVDDVGPDVESFSIALDLQPGPRLARFACVDDAGNEGAVTAVAVERLALQDIPFSLEPPPVVVDGDVVDLVATCDDDVEAAVDDGEPVRCADGAWTAQAALVPGDNVLTVRAAFVGELGFAAQTITATVRATTAGGGP